MVGHYKRASEREMDITNKDALYRLYCIDQLSLKKIARLAGVTISHVHYYMVKFEIARREWSGTKPKFDPLVISTLYWRQNKTVRQIAEELGLGKSTVRRHLAKLGPLRPRSCRLPTPINAIKTGISPQLSVPIPTTTEVRQSLGQITIKAQYDPQQVRYLYWERRLPISQIMRVMKLSRQTVRRELLKFGLLRRPQRSHEYWKGPFSGDDIERAYLLGYRAGDMNAFQQSRITVVARVSTTHQAMLELFEKAFAPYGHCKCDPRRVFLTGYDWQIKVSLDNTFNFLIPKPSHPLSDTRLVYTFLAGLSDSDGSWYVWESRGKTDCGFGLISRNHVMLAELKTALEREGYHALLYLRQKQGTVKVLKGPTQTREITLTMDTWYLSITRREEVKRLARKILPLSRHREKIRRMCLILDETNEDWTIMRPKIEALRRSVGSETADTIRRAEIEYKARHPEPPSGVVG